MIDTNVYGRLLRCSHCSALVDLIEIDLSSQRALHWIDPAEYVCGPCLQPVAVTRPRTAEPPAPPARSAA